MRYSLSRSRATKTKNVQVPLNFIRPFPTLMVLTSIYDPSVKYWNVSSKKPRLSLSVVKFKALLGRETSASRHWSQSLIAKQSVEKTALEQVFLSVLRDSRTIAIPSVPYTQLRSIVKYAIRPISLVLCLRLVGRDLAEGELQLEQQTEIWSGLRLSSPVTE
jgi:hypothetical protein